MGEEDEVYIWWFIIYLKLVFDLLPLMLRNYLIQKLTGDGMKTFVGREGTSDAALKKVL